MHRKMTGLFAALVAFGAFALVPAISSAHGLTDTSGGLTTKIPVGSKIAGYSETATPAKFTGSGLTIECAEVSMIGTVHANPHTAAGAVLGTIENAWFDGHEPGTECKSSLGPATITIPDLPSGGGKSHWCIKSTPETDKFAVEPHACTGAGGAFNFILHAGGLKCSYTRAANLTGTFTTTAATHAAATLSLDANQAMTKTEGGIFCPASGTLSQFNFEMFTDTAGKGTEFRPAANIADPIWIQ